MEKVKFVEVSESYLICLAKALGSPEYLSKHKTGRIFVQFPYPLNGHTYCIPISSPKQSDYYNNRSGKRLVKSDTSHVLRLMYPKATIKNDMLKGTMRIGKMIPVPMSEVKVHIIGEDSRPHYGYLLSVQKQCILSKYEKFIETTVSLYKMKVGAVPRSEQFEVIEKIFASLDFRAAEAFCERYTKCLEQGITEEKIPGAVASISESDGAHGEKSSSRDEQPGCSTWGGSADGGVKRKHDGDDDSRSVRRRLSDSHCGSSRNSSGNGKCVGKGRSRHEHTR